MNDKVSLVYLKLNRMFKFRHEEVYRDLNHSSEIKDKFIYADVVVNLSLKIPIYFCIITYLDIYITKLAMVNMKSTH